MDHWTYFVLIFDTVLFVLIEIHNFFHSVTLVYLVTEIMFVVYLLFTSNTTGQYSKKVCDVIYCIITS